MATRKTVDQILDGAADILEKHGWVTDFCYDSRTGGHCALGAIARAVYPKAPNGKIGVLAYVGDYDDEAYQQAAGRAKDPRHVEAVQFFAQRIARQRKVPLAKADNIVYNFNDRLDSGIVHSYDDQSYEPIITVDEKVRLKSAKKVVAKLRSAAEAYRKQQAKASA